MTAERRVSEDIEKFIPADLEYVPDPTSQEQAVAFLRGILPPPYFSDTDIKATTNEHVEFVDQGANFERVVCPFCFTQLSIKWWHDAMDRAYETHFANLEVTTPCCDSRSSLNDLVYEWPAGFARFVLELREPYYPDEQGVLHPLHLTAEQHQSLQHILNCELRTIWAHY